MKILYVHHGLRDHGQADGLLPLGMDDARLVARLLHQSNLNFVAIYAADNFRCRQTAELINSFINVPILTEKRLDEYRGNETWAECQERIGEAVGDIVDKYAQSDCAICVTSGVNIAAFINLAYGLAPSENAPFITVPSCSPILFDIDKKGV